MKLYHPDHNPVIAQDSPQWLPERRGKLTASRMADALSFNKDGKPSAKRTALMMQLVAERVADYAVDHFVTKEMQWGLDNEAGAKAAYEKRYGVVAGPASLYHHPSIEWFAATPDGTLGDDGVLEIKCPGTPRFLQYSLDGVVPAEYRPQILCQLACTGRKWADFVAFDPRIKEEKHQLFVCRWEPRPEEIHAIEKEAVKFLAEVEAMFRRFTEG